ncbi:glycosyl transferase, partial [Pelagophyceae sp. CCMP2097]
MYGFALEFALDVRFPNAPGVIVVEDDLLFAPDFVDYFENVALVADADPSVFVVSAWNDNGFYSAERDGADAAALRRTGYFPGLGWFLPRKLWAQELKAKWPKTH